jgi:hypothetical protein
MATQVMLKWAFSATGGYAVYQSLVANYNNKTQINCNSNNTLYNLLLLITNAITLAFLYPFIS